MVSERQTKSNRQTEASLHTDKQNQQANTNSQQTVKRDKTLLTIPCHYFAFMLQGNAVQLLYMF